ncbi:MAG: hypothetical protein LZF62_40036 [Nitrospira sp.]|nr:MAG: hypothetical protein LZF62_40036 [Nitrospira sp.]
MTRRRARHNKIGETVNERTGLYSIHSFSRTFLNLETEHGHMPLEVANFFAKLVHVAQY